MRPVLAVVADAYRLADLALRRGKPVEAHRCLQVAQGFERLMLREDGLPEALNEHWAGEEEAWVLRRFPPWPAGVKDAEAARAELADEDARLDALLNAVPIDSERLGAALARSHRLRFCLELAEAAANDAGLGGREAAGTGNPPYPPQPPYESWRADWADSGSDPDATPAQKMV